MFRLVLARERGHGHVTLVSLAGVGKTTSLRILLGQVRATTGTATIGGSAYSELRHSLRTIGAVLVSAVTRAEALLSVLLPRRNDFRSTGADLRPLDRPRRDLDRSISSDVPLRVSGSAR